MPLDPHAGRLLRTLAASSTSGQALPDIGERRANFRKLMSLSACTQGKASSEDRTLSTQDGPVRLRIYSPLGAGDCHLPGLIYFHGGGLVAGSVETHDPMCRELVGAIGCRLISVDYRLAPEHRFPAAIADCHSATQWVTEHAASLHIDATKLGIAGDSAGATLAAVVCQLMRDSGVKLAYQLLLCPIMDFVATTDSRRAFPDDPLINQALMDRDLQLYLPEHMTAEHPQVSPLRANDLSRLPAAYIHTAEFDPLRDEGRLYADRLEAAGIEVHYTCHPGMIHLFHALNRIIPYACVATKLIGGELARRTNDQTRLIRNGRIDAT